MRNHTSLRYYMNARHTKLRSYSRNLGVVCKRPVFLSCVKAEYRHRQMVNLERRVDIEGTLLRPLFQPSIGYFIW